MTSPFESIDFNPEALFTLSYNIEGIKNLFGSIAKNQKILIDRLNNHDTMINKLNNSVKGVLYSNMASPRQPIEQSHISSRTEIPNEGTALSPPVEGRTNVKSEGELIQKPILGLSNTMSNMNGMIIDEEMNERVMSLEKKIKKISSYLQISNDKKGNNESLNDTIDGVKFSIKDIYSKIDEIDNKIEGMSTTIDEIKVKVADFNVYDLFKDAKSDGGSLDASKILVQNLENKIFKKFSLIDEKIKKDEADIFKNKTTVTNLQSIVDNHTKNINDIKAQIETMSNSIDSITKDTNDKFKSVNNSIATETQKIYSEIENIKNEIKAINESNEALLKDDTTNEKEAQQVSSIIDQGTGISDREFKKFKEGILKKFFELEKKFILFNSEMNLDPINRAIDELKTAIVTKASSQEVYDISEKVNSLSSLIDGMHDDENQIVDDNKRINDIINSIVRKIDSLNAQIVLIKNDGSSQSETLRNKINDSRFDNYLQTTQFSEFERTYDRFTEKIRKDIEEMRRSYANIYDLIKEKASEESLKSLEDYLTSLIEEMKDSFAKKYANRIDTNRNFKSIETQMKQIIEVYIKKSDKSNDWLIAKKPLNGYTCASCEAYLGELKDKSEYLAWNKIPSNHIDFDRTIRVGNGFSRILNMLNIDSIHGDQKNYRHTDGFESDGEKKGKRKLPPVCQTEVHNNSIGERQGNVNIYSVDEGKVNSDQPKVMRIYKKAKKEN